jgi:hypothetical protein
VYASPGPPAIYGAWAQAPGPSESDYQSALAPYADANQNDLFSFFLSQELLTQMATAQQHVPTTITAIAPTTIKVDTTFNCSVEICPISLDVEETTQIMVGRDGHLTAGTTADNIVGIEPGSALCLALNPFAVIVDPAWVGSSCGGQIAANRPSLAQTLDEQLPRTADQCNPDGTCTEYDLTYDRFNSRPNDGFVMGVQLAGTTGCPGAVAASCPPPSDAGTVVTQPHALTVRFENIDDDAYVWLGQPGANQDALCSAQGASSQSCDLTTQLQARGAGNGPQRITLKIGNGGCFNSQGDLYVDVDGGNAWHGNLPSGTKLHCGWTYRAELDVDVMAGTVTQVDAHECRLATDCMN